MKYHYYDDMCHMRRMNTLQGMCNLHILIGQNRMISVVCRLHKQPKPPQLEEKGRLQAR